MKGQPSSLDWMQFVAKYFVIAVSAIWVLCVGTDYIKKQTAEVEYRNLKLGKNSVPIAKQSLDLNIDNDPWIGAENLCTITGQYIITNEGALPFKIDSVTFKVFELPVLGASEALEKKVSSRTLSKLLEAYSPIFTEEIASSARVGATGKYSKSFIYIINRKKGMNYTVSANAAGAVIGVRDSDSLLTFGPNELKIESGASAICGGDKTLPNEK